MRLCPLKKKKMLPLFSEKVEAHLKAGAKKIIFSAPAKDDSPVVVMGVNQGTYTSDMKVGRGHGGHFMPFLTLGRTRKIIIMCPGTKNYLI